jgi:C1A family cysteine protease
MSNDFLIDENYKFDEVDSRDYLYSASPSNLPSFIDLRPLDNEVENQGLIGSCVANAGISCLELMKSQFSTFEDYSRLFLYYELRNPYTNLKGKDKGSYTRDAFKIPNKVGLPLESDYPYITSKMDDVPPDSVYKSALGNKVNKYARISGTQDEIKKSIKYALSKGVPVLFGASVTNQIFKVNSLEKTYLGYTKGLANGYTSAGGHAMCIVGYDDSVNGFIIENSWGKYWGENGYGMFDQNTTVTESVDIWVCTSFDDVSIDLSIEKPEPVNPPAPKPKSRSNKITTVIAIAVIAGILIYTQVR